MLKNTGMTRKIDELGRIVIPKEVRNSLKITAGDDLEIFLNNDSIVLRKYSPLACLENESNHLISSVNDLVDSNVFISDKERIITKGLLEGKEIPVIFKENLQDRKIYESIANEIMKFETKNIEGFFYSEPIIQNSDANGLVILVKDTPITQQDRFFAKVLKNIIENK